MLEEEEAGTLEEQRLANEEKLEKLLDEYETIRQDARDWLRAAVRDLKDEYRAFRSETRGMEKDARKEARRAEKDRIDALKEELEQVAEDQEKEALTALMSAFEDMA